MSRGGLAAGVVEMVKVDTAPPGAQREAPAHHLGTTASCPQPNPLAPSLRAGSGLQVKPTVSDLGKMTNAELARVKNFTVFHEYYGSVVWPARRH